MTPRNRISSSTAQPEPEVCMRRAVLMILSLFVLSVPGFPQANCTRADLQAAVEGYLAAQRGGNPAALPLTASAKYIENTVETPLDKSIVKSALKIDFDRSIF